LRPLSISPLLLDLIRSALKPGIDCNRPHAGLDIEIEFQSSYADWEGTLQTASPLLPTDGEYLMDTVVGGIKESSHEPDGCEQMETSQVR
jgi:hypothetical protein